MDEVFKQYGILGAIIIGLAGYILRIEARHKKERDEAKATEREQFNRLNKINDATNDILRENSTILKGLTTLLERRK